MEEKLPKVLRHSIQAIHSYDLLEHEVRQLAEGGNAGKLFFELMSIALSIGFTALATLCMIPISEVWKLLLFTVLTVFGLGSGMILCVLWLGAKKRQGPLLTTILSRPVIGPIGEEGRELPPTEIKSLPESKAEDQGSR
ncbi:MAG: hypothetical protein Q8R91_05535 [Candidatus Omnitrophota bacterium]|nr:hypothetical protein [Candidatus Omnitrophota bacterium]